jgi:hypothetical protein
MAHPPGDAQKRSPASGKAGDLKSIVSREPPTSKPNQDRPQVHVTRVEPEPPLRCDQRNIEPLHCAACGRELAAEEPVWRGKVSRGRGWLGGWRYVLQTHCEQCKSDLCSYRRAGRRRGAP